MRKLEGLFGNQWGRLLEALVKPGVLRLFQTRGIPVHNLYHRAEAHIDLQKSFVPSSHWKMWYKTFLGNHSNGRTMEIDLLLENTTAAIAVEVKSQMTVEFISDFLDDPAQFHQFFPKYKGYQLYGAVAGLDISPDITRYAYRRGLFVVSSQ